MPSLLWSQMPSPSWRQQHLATLLYFIVFFVLSAFLRSEEIPLFVCLFVCLSCNVWERTAPPFPPLEPSDIMGKVACDEMYGTRSFAVATLLR